jgi:hypothetical protein
VEAVFRPSRLNEGDKIGGASRDRSDDLTVANDALCHSAPAFMLVSESFTFQNVPHGPFSGLPGELPPQFFRLLRMAADARLARPRRGTQYLTQAGTLRRGFLFPDSKVTQGHDECN